MSQVKESRVKWATRRARARMTTLGIGLVTVASGCAAFRDDGGRPLTTLDPKAPASQWIDDLFIQLMIAAGIIFVLVEGAVLVMAWKFRRRRTDVDGQNEPVQTHGNPRLEWAWTFAPAILLAFLAVGSVQTLWDLEDREADAMTVEVIGHQWWWEYRYDSDEDGTIDIITANQMVVPVGRQVELKIKSNDVIHSFWIPALNGKKDAVPGRINEWRLKATEAGIYQGTCTEFCGLSHAYMRMEVKALEPAEFDEWVAAQREVPEVPKPGSLEETGRSEFVAQCAACHQINGMDPSGEKTDGEVDPEYNKGEVPLASGNAPNLTHLMSRERFAGNLFELYTELDGEKVVNEATLGEWLRAPELMKPADAFAQRGMPNRNLSQEQIDALVAYLTSLK